MSRSNRANWLVRLSSSGKVGLPGGAPGGGGDIDSRLTCDREDLGVILSALEWRAIACRSWWSVSGGFALAMAGRCLLVGPVDEGSPRWPCASRPLNYSEGPSLDLSRLSVTFEQRRAWLLDDPGPASGPVDESRGSALVVGETLRCANGMVLTLERHAMHVRRDREGVWVRGDGRDIRALHEGWPA